MTELDLAAEADFAEWVAKVQLVDKAISEARKALPYGTRTKTDLKGKKRCSCGGMISWSSRAKSRGFNATCDTCKFAVMS